MSMLWAKTNRLKRTNQHEDKGGDWRRECGLLLEMQFLQKRNRNYKNNKLVQSTMRI